MNKLKSIGIFIDEAWERFLGSLPLMLKIGAWYVIVVIIGLVAYFMQPTYADLPFVDNLDMIYTPITAVGSVLSLVNVMLFTPLLTLLLGIAMILGYQAYDDKKQTDAQTEIADAWRYFIPVLTVTIIFSLMLAVVTLLLVMPGIGLLFLAGDSSILGSISMILTLLGFIGAIIGVIYLSTRYAFIQYGIVLKNINLKDSFDHSTNLVKGRFWSVLLRLLIIGLIFLIITVTFEFVLFGIGFGITNLFDSQPIILERVSVILDFLFSQMVFMLSAPLATAFLYTLYVDLLESR